jgi:hypothetical protein
MYYADSKKVFEGKWRDDEKNGEGTLYKPDGSIKKGIWKGEKLVSKSTEINKKRN